MGLNLYLPVDHKKRAAQHRKDARELAAAGYPCTADLNWEMAEWLDPTPRERPEPKRRRVSQSQQQFSSQQHSNSRIEKGNGPIAATARPARPPRPFPRRGLPVNAARPTPDRQVRARP